MSHTEGSSMYPSSRVSFRVIGMTCASCARSLETLLSPSNGINSVSVNYPNQSIIIDFNEEIVTVDILKSKAREFGYQLICEEDKNSDSFEYMEDVSINAKSINTKKLKD